MRLTVWAVSLAIGVMGVALPASGQEDPETLKARAEVEAQLKTLVKIPEPFFEVDYDGIDSTRYKLVSASLRLDGHPLPLSPGEHPLRVLFQSAVAPGRHMLEGELVYQESTHTLLSSVEGATFKLPIKQTLFAHRGLASTFHLSVTVDDGEHDPRKRLQVEFAYKGEIKAVLDDGSMPPAEAKKLVAAAASPTGGQAEEDEEAEDRSPSPSSKSAEAPPSRKEPGHHRRHSVRASQAEAKGQEPQEAREPVAVRDVAPPTPSPPTPSPAEPKVALATVAQEVPVAQQNPPSPPPPAPAPSPASGGAAASETERFNPRAWLGWGLLVGAGLCLVLAMAPRRRKRHP
jgi:hypothetical protein